MKLSELAVMTSLLGKSKQLVTSFYQKTYTVFLSKLIPVCILGSVELICAFVNCESQKIMKYFYGPHHYSI